MAGSFVSRAEMNDMRNAAVEELQDSAHRRRMNRMADFAESNPNAMAPSQTRHFLGWRHNQGTTGREDELHGQRMAMLELESKTRLGEAEAKKLGSIGQGSEAAKLNKEAAEIESNNKLQLGLKTLETNQQMKDAELAAMKEMEQGKLQLGRETLDSEERRAELQHGYVDEKTGMRVEGSAERAAAKQAEAAAAAQLARGEVEKYKADAQREARISAARTAIEKAQGSDKAGLIKKMIETGQITKEEAIEMLNEDVESASGDGGKVQKTSKWARS